MSLNRFQVPPGKAIRLKDYSTSATEPYGDKQEARKKLEDDVRALTEWQAKLYAQNTYALLIILQGIDASGKDGTIKHVMSGVNPTGCHVKSFKTPSEEEQRHDYLWRCACALPERGKIGIFNRSYYEEVLVVRVHPQLLEKERIHTSKKRDKLWAERYEQINQFERYLTANGFEVLKFYLHMSKDVQKRRFLDRLNSDDKNWKFAEADIQEREFWDDYIRAYEEMISHTSTEHAPWHVIPADHKWFAHMAVADAIVGKLASLDLEFPRLRGKQKEELNSAKKMLESE
jgi:PPK2 family polyphosphate:nucleotide phosphotransferase